MSSKFTIFFSTMQPRLSALQAPHGQFTTTFAGTVQVPVPYFRRHAEEKPRTLRRYTAGILPGYALRSPSPPVPLHGIPAFSGPFHSPLPRYSRMMPARHRHTPMTAPGAHLRLQSATVHSTVLRPGTEIEIASCDGAVALRHSPWAPLHKRTTAVTAPHPDIFRASALPGASRRKPTL